MLPELARRRGGESLGPRRFADELFGLAGGKQQVALGRLFGVGRQRAQRAQQPQDQLGQLAPGPGGHRLPPQPDAADQRGIHAHADQAAQGAVQGSLGHGRGLFQGLLAAGMRLRQFHGARARRGRPRVGHRGQRPPVPHRRGFRVEQREFLPAQQGRRPQRQLDEPRQHLGHAAQRLGADEGARALVLPAALRAPRRSRQRRRPQDHRRARGPLRRQRERPRRLRRLQARKRLGRPDRRQQRSQQAHAAAAPQRRRQLRHEEFRRLERPAPSLRGHVQRQRRF